MDSANEYVNRENAQGAAHGRGKAVNFKRCRLIVYAWPVSAALKLQDKSLSSFLVEMHKKVTSCKMPQWMIECLGKVK